MALDLLELASRVSDGDVVDWGAAEAAVLHADEHGALRNLRHLDTLARAHRSLPGRAMSPHDLARMSDTIVPFLRPGPAPPAPRSWGPLELRAKLGEGAFGEVYRAWDTRLEREVALKLLKGGADEQQARALHEGRLLARLSHPNVVTVHGAEQHEGRVGLWMELVPGKSLGNWVEEHGRLGAREAALVGIDLCRALAAVHGAGLVHRDLKAHNVMRQEGGRLLLMDFGAGREMAAAGDGKISGTPLYIAPEIFAGEPATPRSDLYSLGVLLHHLVTGSYPVQASTTAALRARLERREFRLLRDERPDLPESFLAAVERALAPDPAARFASAGEMERALVATLGGSTTETTVSASRHRTSRKRAVGIAAAAATLVLAGLLLFLARDRSGSGPYTARASLLRIGVDGRREALAPGSRLALGDRLMLEFEASRELHLYVIDEDEQGRAFVLFPLPDLELSNPLAGGEAHLLPGPRDGRRTHWIVDSTGGRERLLVLASPQRLVAFEAELSRIPRPTAGRLGVELPVEATRVLRGIGGIGIGEAPRPATEGAARLFEMAHGIAGTSETTDGIWLRQIELENPAP